MKNAAITTQTVLKIFNFKWHRYLSAFGAVLLKSVLLNADMKLYQFINQNSKLKFFVIMYFIHTV